MEFVSAATTWLLSKAGSAALSRCTHHVLILSGMVDELDPAATAVQVNALNEHLMELQKRLDEDRIAKAAAAWSLLRDSAHTSLAREHIAHALDRFHEVINLPLTGSTAGIPNAQLRSLAFLGMAAAHSALDEPTLAASKLAKAVWADRQTAATLLGTEIAGPLLRLHTRQVGATLRPHLYTGPLAIGPDGKTLATAGYDGYRSKGSVRLWDAETGECLRSLSLPQTHECPVMLSFSSDGMFLVAAGSGYLVHLHETLISKFPPDLLLWSNRESRIDALSRMRFNSESYECIHDAGLMIWDLRSGDLMTLPIRGVTAAVVAADGLCVALSDVTCTAWNIQDGKRQDVDWHSQYLGIPSPKALALSPSSTSFAVGCRDGKIALYERSSRFVQRVMSLPSLPSYWNERTSIRQLAFSPHDDTLAFEAGGNLMLWNFNSGAVEVALDLSGGIPESFDPRYHGLRFVGDGALIAVVLREGQAVIYNVKDRTTKYLKLPIKSFIRDAVFSPDGTLVVLASEEGLLIHPMSL